MTHFVGAEGIGDATIRYIDALWDTKRASLQTHWDAHDAAESRDPIGTLDAWGAIRFLEPWQQSEAQYPVLYVRPAGFTGAGSFGSGTLRGDHLFMFAVLTAISAAGEPETVLRLGMRYLLGVYEMLHDMHDHNDNSYHVAGQTLHWETGDAPTTFEFDPLYSRESGEWLGDVRMLVAVHLKETRS